MSAGLDDATDDPDLRLIVEAVEDATLAKLITARARHRLAVRSAGWLALAVEAAVTLLAAFLVHERRVAALRTDLTDGRARIDVGDAAAGNR